MQAQAEVAFARTLAHDVLFVLWQLESQHSKVIHVQERATMCIQNLTQRRKTPLQLTSAVLQRQVPACHFWQILQIWHFAFQTWECAPNFSVVWRCVALEGSFESCHEVQGNSLQL